MVDDNIIDSFNKIEMDLENLKKALGITKKSLKEQRDMIQDKYDRLIGKYSDEPHGSDWDQYDLNN
jgi:hypothetical protein|tara:strand:+ start:10426 stop:10623 length:198 start_codon:yes stop_codon:yes gene_type:complete